MRRRTLHQLTLADMEERSRSLGGTGPGSHGGNDSANERGESCGGTDGRRDEDNGSHEGCGRVVMEELGMKGLVMGAVLTVVVEAAPHVMEVVVGAAAPPHALWQSAEAGAQVRRRRRRHRPSTGIV